MVGLLYRKEEKMESIKDALIRYIEHSNSRDEPLLKPFQKASSAVVPAESISPEFLRELDLMELYDIRFDKELRVYNEKNPDRRYSYH